MGVEKERGGWGWEWESWGVETRLDWVGVERRGMEWIIVDDPSEEVGGGGSSVGMHRYGHHLCLEG